MLTIGDKVPAFDLTAVFDTTVPLDGFPRITHKSYPQKWTILFFWPKDFTVVCPTEIIAFNDLKREFDNRDAVLLGASTDSEFVHLVWRQSRGDLAAVDFPWLADMRKDLTKALGILDEGEGVARRATFIADPDGIIRYAAVNDISVGRNPTEVLRILDALQTDELCPGNWTPGTETLSSSPR